MHVMFGKYNHQPWHTSHHDYVIIELGAVEMNQLRKQWGVGDPITICPIQTATGPALRRGLVNGRGYEFSPSSNTDRWRVTFTSRYFPWVKQLVHCALSPVPAELNEGGDLLLKVPSGLPAPSYMQREKKADKVRREAIAPPTPPPRKRGGGVVLLELEGIQCSFVNVPIDIRLQVANLLRGYQEING